MSQLTYEQATLLGEHLYSIALTIQRYRENNIQDLTSAQDKKLEKIETSLISQSNQLFVKSAIFSLDEAADVLEEMKQINTGIEKTIKKISKVQTVIDLLTSVLNFGTAVIAKDIPGINESFDALKSKWDELKPAASNTTKSLTKKVKSTKKKTK